MPPRIWYSRLATILAQNAYHDAYHKKYKNIRIPEYEILLIVYLLAFSFGIFINTDYFLKKKITNISLSKPLFPCSSPSGHSSVSNQGNAKLVQRAKGLTIINLKFSLWLSGKTCTFLGSPVLFVQVTAWWLWYPLGILITESLYFLQRASLNEASWDILRFMRNQCLLWNTKPNPIWRSYNSPSDKCPNPFLIWLLLTLQVSGVHKPSTTMHSNWIQMSSTSLWFLFLGRRIEMGKYPALQHCLQAICSLIGPMVNSLITVFIHSPVSPFKLCLQTQKKCIQDFLALSPQSAHYTWTIFLQPQYNQELAFFYCRSKLNGLYYKYLFSLF